MAGGLPRWESVGESLLMGRHGPSSGVVIGGSLSSFLGALLSVRAMIKEHAHMRTMFKIFALLYMVAPIIFVPCLAYYLGNWFLLFGILFSYAGSIAAAFKSKLIIVLPIFCIGFWIHSGFDIHQYVTFYFFCSLWGTMTFKIAEGYDQESKRGTLDNDQEMLKHLSENKEEIEARVLQFLKDNPGKQPTYDDMEALVRGKK